MMNGNFRIVLAHTLSNGNYCNVTVGNVGFLDNGKIDAQCFLTLPFEDEADV